MTRYKNITSTKNLGRRGPDDHVFMEKDGKQVWRRSKHVKEYERIGWSVVKEKKKAVSDE